MKRRLGLDAAASWVITRELNRFVWPGHDLRPISRDQPDVFAWGFLPAVFLGLLKAAALASAAAGMGKDDAREMLEEAVAELLGKLAEGHRASLAPSLDA